MPGAPFLPQRIFTGAVRAATDLIFPRRCLACRKLGSYFCDGCQQSLRLLPDPFCPTCGIPVDPQSPVCHCHHPTLAFTVAAAEFNGQLREAIHRFKYKGQWAGAPALADLLIPHLRGILIPSHVIVPVPLHPQRERQRGYNQAVLLAHAIAKELHAAHAAHALRRVRFTEPQVHLDAAQRAKNMGGAFHGDPTELKGRTILLLDDVCTTGATLQAAAQAAREAGAIRIYAAVIAAAPQHARVR